MSLIVNLLFVMLGWTKTLNVDIWNFWFPCFLGLVAQAVTGNFVTGILGALVAVMLQWLLADIFQKKVSEFFWISRNCNFSYDGVIRSIDRSTIKLDF